MTKRERIEDLGVISEKLKYILDDFDDNIPSIFGSKHDYEKFCQYISIEDNRYILHTFIRNHIDSLWEIYGIARGEDE